MACDYVYNPEFFIEKEVPLMEKEELNTDRSSLSFSVHDEGKLAPE